MLELHESTRRRIAKTSALPMFCLSVLFLVVVATMIVLWVDVPRVIAIRYAENDSWSDELTAVMMAEQSAEVQSAMTAGDRCLLLLAILWPLFIAEFILQLVVQPRGQPIWGQRYYGLIVCLCPPLRLAVRNHDMDGKIWLPGLGWQTVNDALRDRLERVFNVPMVLIALAILPVLLIEVGMSQLVAAHPSLQVLLHVSMGLIWFAFAAEFIVLVSVAEKKLRYCKEHWLDLAIIFLPLISFLRSLRVIRATRLARLAKIQQLMKMGRVYRLRGLALRTFRAVLMFGLLNRLLRITPEKRLQKLRLQLADKESEIVALQQAIEDLEQRIHAVKKSAGPTAAKRQNQGPELESGSDRDVGQVGSSRSVS